MPSATAAPTAPLPPSVESLIPPIRVASRQLVREWGFMRPTIAGTALSGAAVHALIEIGGAGDQTTGLGDLSRVLRVGLAAAKQAVRELQAAGHLAPPAATTTSGFTLTSAGRETLAAVHAHATAQVATALAALRPDEAAGVLSGLQSYAAALETWSGGPAGAAAEVECAPPGAEHGHAGVLDDIGIEAGYRPGILGRTLEMHMAYYANHHGWGRSFESSLAADLGALGERLDRPRCEVFAAVWRCRRADGPGPAEKTIVGTVYVDGDDGVAEGVSTAQIRCFLVEDAVRGRGVGRRLLAAAMAFVRRTGFAEVTLWTMTKLLPARRLYEEAGFRVAREEELVKWGQRDLFQKYAWRRPRGGGDDGEVASATADHIDGP